MNFAVVEARAAAEELVGEGGGGEEGMWKLGWVGIVRLRRRWRSAAYGESGWSASSSEGVAVVWVWGSNDSAVGPLAGPNGRCWMVCGCDAVWTGGIVGGLTWLGSWVSVGPDGRSFDSSFAI